MLGYLVMVSDRFKVFAIAIRNSVDGRLTLLICIQDVVICIPKSKAVGYRRDLLVGPV